MHWYSSRHQKFNIIWKYYTNTDIAPSNLWKNTLFCINKFTRWSDNYRFRIINYEPPNDGRFSSNLSGTKHNKRINTFNIYKCFVQFTQFYTQQLISHISCTDWLIVYRNVTEIYLAQWTSSRMFYQYTGWPNKK